MSLRSCHGHPPGRFSGVQGSAKQDEAGKDVTLGPIGERPLRLELSRGSTGSGEGKPWGRRPSCLRRGLLTVSSTGDLSPN